MKYLEGYQSDDLVNTRAEEDKNYFNLQSLFGGGSSNKFGMSVRFFFFFLVVVVVVVVENDMSVKLNVFDLPSRAEEDKSYFNLQSLFGGKVQISLV